MKSYLRIFCLYLFALSCIPCNDGEHGHDAAPDSGETEMLTENHDSPTHEHCADFCPPFCSCACCGCATSTNKMATLAMSAPAAEHLQPSFTYQAPFSTEHLSALFRPPIHKLG